uniref:Salivary lipocalin n=1 Tax=Rhabditophanes sp. KR3021 TaxID=114890 RepID=A0AC35UF36_9BILA
MTKLSVAVFLIVVGYCQGVWIGEEYWTSVNMDGSFRDNRQVQDFIVLPPNRNLRDNLKDIYVAFWITKDEGHYEAFGTATRGEDGRICATFLTRYNTKEELCGGFRILSKHLRTGASPFQWVPANECDRKLAVSYRRKQIARTYSFHKQENFISTANLKEKSAIGVESDGIIVRVEANEFPQHYNEYVEILIKNPDLENINFEEVERLRLEREEQERLRREREEQLRRLSQYENEDNTIHNLENDNVNFRKMRRS